MDSIEHQSAKTMKRIGVQVLRCQYRLYITGTDMGLGCCFRDQE